MELLTSFFYVFFQIFVKLRLRRYSFGMDSNSKAKNILPSLASSKCFACFSFACQLFYHARQRQAVKTSHFSPCCHHGNYYCDASALIRLCQTVTAACSAGDPRASGRPGPFSFGLGSSLPSPRPPPSHSHGLVARQSPPPRAMALAMATHSPLGHSPSPRPTRPLLTHSPSHTGHMSQCHYPTTSAGTTELEPPQQPGYENTRLLTAFAVTCAQEPAPPLTRASSSPPAPSPSRFHDPRPLAMSGGIVPSLRGAFLLLPTR